jgi:hypothetical protein
MTDDAPKTPIEKILLLLVAAASIVSGAMIAIGSVFENFAKTTIILQKFDSWQLGIISFPLLIIAAWSFVRFRRKQSILIKPDRLRLDRKNPLHLKGRDGDLDSLVPLVQSARLTFLQGWSGAGKTALLSAGLLVRLRDIPSILPIFVESLVGDDWEQDPRRFVAAALTTAISEILSPDQRKKLFPDNVVAPDSVMDALGQVFSALGRMPLVLLDQFDDYQTRHLDKFVVDNSWLKPEALVARNTFWADLKALVDAGLIHCLIATGRDSAGGLESVRFCEPATYLVDALKARYVSDVINTLVNSDDNTVVSDPACGWTDLVKRLVDDLERGDVVLPQQLRIVLLGLGTLPYRILSVSAYERAGGVPGIEARFVQDCISRVSRLASVQPEQLRAILLAMVERDKTIEQSDAQLQTVVPGLSEEQLNIALREFERLEIVRCRVGADTRWRKWLLDHDYLARSVRDADRLANRWTRELADGEKKLGYAGTSWLLWWQALLPAQTQLRFFIDWVHGRYRYGEYRRYAVVSAARFTPYLLVFSVIAIGGIFQYQRFKTQRIEDSVAAQLNILTFDRNRNLAGYDLSANDGAALIALASMDDRARLLAMERVINDGSRRVKLLRRPHSLINAIVGNSLSRRLMATSLIVSATAAMESRQYPSDEAEAIARVAVALEVVANLPFSWWLNAYNANKQNATAASALGTGLTKLGDQLTKEQTKAVITAFLEQYERLPALRRCLTELVEQLTTDQMKVMMTALKSSLFKDLSGDFANLANVLSLEQTRVLVAALILEIETDKNLDVVAFLGQQLSLIFGKMSEDHAKAVIPDLIASIQNTNNARANHLRQSVVPLAPHMNANQAQQAITAILDSNDFEYLASLANEMTVDQAKQAILRLITEIKILKYGPLTREQVLVRLTKRMRVDQAKAVIPDLYNAIADETNSNEVIDTLIRGLAPLKDSMNDSQTNVVISRALSRIDKDNITAQALRDIGVDLAPFTDNMTAGQTKKVIATFLAAVDRSRTGSIESRELESGMAALTRNMGNDQANIVISELVTGIAANINTRPAVLNTYVTGLVSLADKMTKNQIRVVISTLFAAIRGNVLNRAVELAETLSKLIDKMTTDQALELIPEFISAIDELRTFAVMPYALGESLQALIKKVPDDKAEIVITAFVSEIDLRNNCSEEGSFLFGRIMSFLAVRMTSDQKNNVVAVLLDAVQSNKGRPDTLRKIGDCLKPLARMLSVDQASTLLAILRTAVEEDLANDYATIIASTGPQGLRSERVLLIFEALDHPLIDGERSTSLLESLSSIAGPANSFKGRFWDGMAWIQKEGEAGRLPGYPPSSLFAKRNR